EERRPQSGVRECDGQAHSGARGRCDESWVRDLRVRRGGHIQDGRGGAGRALPRVPHRRAQSGLQRAVLALQEVVLRARTAAVGRGRNRRRITGAAADRGPCKGGKECWKRYELRSWKRTWNWCGGGWWSTPSATPAASRARKGWSRSSRAASRTTR